MRPGAAPLIIAGVAALVTYAAFGNQTPFGFLHHFTRHHPKITVSTDTPDDAQKADDERQEARDRAQEIRDRAQALSERAKELALEASQKVMVDTQKAVAAAVPPLPSATAPGTEVRALEPFDSITIENNADVTVTIGDRQSVMLTGGIGHTETRVHDGKLTVGGSVPGVRVAIVVPHLHALQVNGYGKVSLVGLRDPIAIKANGAVQLWGSGVVDSAELTMNGPGKFALAKLEAKNLVVQINGVGDADVNATENLVADVRGVGRVSYRGSPHLVTKINGPGSVQHVASNEG